MSTRRTTSDQEEITIMAYVTNIREAQLVYIKVHVAKIDPVFRKLLKAGLTIRHPNMPDCTVPTLAQNEYVGETRTIPSRGRIFCCIVEGVDCRLTNFLHESDGEDSVYAGRVFVYLCQIMKTADIANTAANSGNKAWESLRDALKTQYTNRNDYSAHDIGFSSTDGDGQNIFREETVLLMRRDIVETQKEHSSYIQDVMLDQGGNNLIMDCIVLMQQTRPTALMTLNQIANEHHPRLHHLYRLVAVYDFGANLVHWLDVENWNFIKTMPTCESSDLRWFGTSPSTDDPLVFDDTAYSFEQMQQKLATPVVSTKYPQSAAIRATRYICFYQRLTRNRGCENAVAIRMSSPVARYQAKSFQTLFGMRSQILESILQDLAAKDAKLPPETSTAFDDLTQRCVRTLAVAMKLLGFLVVNELQASFQLPPMDVRECHLCVYLLWNKFVIQEGFHVETEVVCKGLILGHAVADLGNIDLHALIARFHAFLSQQCAILHTTRSADLEEAFLNPHNLLQNFPAVVADHHACNTTRHAIQSLRQFEARVVKLRDKDTYPLGNTKLMLHYFSNVLGFKALANYLSNIRDTLV